MYAPLRVPIDCDFHSTSQVNGKKLNSLYQHFKRCEVKEHFPLWNCTVTALNGLSAVTAPPISLFDGPTDRTEVFLQCPFHKSLQEHNLTVGWLGYSQFDSQPSYQQPAKILWLAFK